MPRERTRRDVLALAGTTLALAGCVGSGDESDDEEADDVSTGGADDEPSDERTSDEQTDDGTGDSSTDEATGGMDDESSDDGTDETTADGWRGATLEDATTGESFSVAGLDKPVVLHTFATWCPKCRNQQESIDSLHEQRGDEIAFVDLTIDPNDDSEAIREHAADNGFEWRFAVAPTDVTRDLVDEFGQAVASAPQSPVIVVCPSGSTRTLDKGASASEIGEAVDQECG